MTDPASNCHGINTDATSQFGCQNVMLYHRRAPRCRAGDREIKYVGISVDCNFATCLLFSV